MNIYGDFGNLLVLRHRAWQRGIEVLVSDYHPCEDMPTDVDLLLGGGGQDSGQLVVQDDLPRIAQTLHNLVDGGVAALMICGMYQLFGNYFRTASGAEIRGLGILDLYTEAGDSRMIGNIVTQSSEFGEIIGYENHSGRTWLSSTTQPFAHAEKGMGNNGKDNTEGARMNRVIGTYLHGPLLPKNPAVADFLLYAALEHADTHGHALTPQEQEYLHLGKLPDIDDSLANRARHCARARPR
jgi:CobQ-like glutamine amidotransferase family enzyme